MPEEQTFLRRLCDGGASLGIDLPGDGLVRLQIHFRLLCRWADRVNLTTVRDPEEMAELLYLDSAVLQGHLAACERLHDVGTGAGFPGLVLKALRPDLQVTLTEARRKKVSFLKQAAREMGLSEGLWIRNRRIGWEPLSEREQWTEVVSRAAFPPLLWVRKGAPLVAPGGRLWVCSGQPLGEEQDSLERVLADLEGALPRGFEREQVLEYRLPFSGRKRLLVPVRLGPVE
jgi:16S rRNA (guanine527-N7)-methyltransferase